MRRRPDSADESDDAFPGARRGLRAPDGESLWVTSGDSRRIAVYGLTGRRPSGDDRRREPLPSTSPSSGTALRRERRRRDGSHPPPQRRPRSRGGGSGRLLQRDHLRRKLGRHSVPLARHRHGARQSRPGPGRSEDRACRSRRLPGHLKGAHMKVLLRSFSALVLVGAIAVGSAGANGSPYSPGLAYGWPGVASLGQVHYVTFGPSKWTVVAAVRANDGHVVRTGTVRGFYAVPLVAYDGTAGGLSGDGKSLVLTSYWTAARPIRQDALRPREHEDARRSACISCSTGRGRSMRSPRMARRSISPSTCAPATTRLSRSAARHEHGAASGCHRRSARERGRDGRHPGGEGIES